MSELDLKFDNDDDDDSMESISRLLRRTQAFHESKALLFNIF